jgi:hypothetical protein
MVSTREEYWDDNFDLPLQNLPPMGHSVKVEGGSPPERRPSKLVKSNQSSVPGSKNGREGSTSPTVGLGITKTYDFRSYSFSEEPTPPLAPSPFGPLEKSGGHVSRA